MGERIERGHQADDINAAAIMRVWIALIVIIVVSAGVSYVLSVHFIAEGLTYDSATATSIETRFPAPHLQSDPVADLNALRAEKAALLNSYGRVDEQTVRIPITRAMQLLAERHALGAKPEQR